MIPLQKWPPDEKNKFYAYKRGYFKMSVNSCRRKKWYLCVPHDEPSPVNKEDTAQDI